MSTQRPARLRAAAVSAVLVLGATGALAPAATAADKLHQRQSQAHRQVRSAQHDAEESSARLNAARAKVAAVASELRSAQATLRSAQSSLRWAERTDALLRADLASAEQRLATAQAALARAVQDVHDQRAEIGNIAASNYAYGDPNLMGLSVILNSQDPAAATSQLNTVSSLMSRQTATLDRLKAARLSMAAEETQVQQATDQVAAQKKQAAANVVRKTTLERSAAHAKWIVTRLLRQAHTAEVLATRARRADLAQLRAAKRQEDRIKRLIMQRAARQHGGYRGGTGGFLFRPVPGYVTSPFGWRIHPIYHYWGLHDGTDFHAPCGTPERAAGYGRVIAESWSDVYGHRLYLDLGQVNGKNMTVVYNHLSSYVVGQGARVRRGQVVGRAGSTGWSTGCHLHFTVLVNGNPVNPMNYM